MFSVSLSEVELMVADVLSVLIEVKFPLRSTSPAHKPLPLGLLKVVAASGPGVYTNLISPLPSYNTT